MRRIAGSAVVGLVAAAGVLAGMQPAAAVTGPPVRIVSVQYDSPGTDSRSNASLNAEWVVLRNVTGARVDLTGWTLRDAQNQVYSFGALTLAARATVRVHTGRGTNTAADRYWGRSNYVWNNTGDRAVLRSRTAVAQTCSWGRGSGSVTC